MMAEDQHIVEEGPWRATRLWNSIVQSLHQGIPRKKHRKHLRTYEDCFTANEAIEWLCKQLKRNPNFDSDVSKDQTLMLLQKLYRAGVIVRISDEDLSTSSISKTPCSAMLTQSNDTFKAGNDLYRLAPKANAVLSTPGKSSKKVNEIRSPLQDLGNTPLTSSGSMLDEKSSALGRSGTLGSGLRRSFRKIKNKHLLRNHNIESSDDEEEEEDVIDEAVENNPRINAEQRQNLNISYLQSLPANSLVVLDNDCMWREVYVKLLSVQLSDAHVASLGENINVKRIIYNMTNVSPKGIVQLHGMDKNNDLPKWTLSAMKCLANWPKHFQVFIGAQMPNYEGFEKDVFNVVKEYFTSLPIPLTTFELFDILVSTFIKAEAVSALQKESHIRSRFAVTPMPSYVPYMETDLDAYSRPSSTSTPSGYYSASGSSTNLGRILTTTERMANIRPTTQCLPHQYNLQNQQLSAHMSPTAIMRNFLPPNTCFETAFMNEIPTTRIVPQKGAETIHYPAARPSSRMSSTARIPLSSAASNRSSSTVWDSRSIATQTSDEEGDGLNRQVRSRQPRWKRTSRQRKSIAVMDSNFSTNQPSNRFRSASYSTSALPPTRNQHIHEKIRGCSSVENFLDEGEKQFLAKYQQQLQTSDGEAMSRKNRRYSMVSLPSTNMAERRFNSPSDNVILSKTVRKEKRKQREKREKSFETPLSCSRQTSDVYQHLNYKTPMHICGKNAPIPYMDEGMQNARAEPFHGSLESLNGQGKQMAIETFQLLGLLLPPENRRQLQLLLKFMRRVRSKQGLILDSHKKCHDVVVETFSEAILRPRFDLANYDEELCRKIVCFFIDNFDEIWTPPVSLRKEVEEIVYQSLVNKRIEAGEDPYPITFCQRVPSKVYEKEKVTGVQAAMLDLLDQIINDKKMNTKEKKKKLKKFKMAYPDVYAKKFPTPQSEPEFVRNNSFSASMSLTRLRSVMRI